ncbi:MAG TPA: RNB domain-containing ribonuclease [Thermoanaerobaculia bacterium]|nr:RNB domain-containing ribonuclease [Thermoanaerobaculia bacterium]
METPDLEEIARRAMIERGLEPDFPPRVVEETAALREIRAFGGRNGIRDLRQLPWFSIDNDDTRDLDQLTVAERSGGTIRILVAIADVDEMVPKESATDGHAGRNTTSVYTPARVFPMLPERLSTGLTSLHEGEDRLAVVVEMQVGADGAVSDASLYRASVHNHARLTYDAVTVWLEGKGTIPPTLQGHLQLQDEAAARLRQRRHERGALRFDTLRLRPLVEDGKVRGLVEDRRNRANELIEDFMLAANSATASFLEKRGLPSLRRIVRSPQRWPRIVEIAAQLGETLPPDPETAALARFLDRRQAADPEGYPELSLSVLKLIGAGEYTVDLPGRPAPGHFGLAADDYTHATAPNRRYPDLVTQRLVKAVLAGRPAPYAGEELEELARWCTRKEDDARRVERQVTKSAVALLLADRIGQQFEAIVTGASEKGTWVRTCRPPVEGKLTCGFENLDVGDRVQVRLIEVDVERGFIDFAC